MRIVRILDEWLGWTTAGGMKKQQYHMLEGEKDRLPSCFAVSLVAVVADFTNSNHVGMGKVGADMLECLRLWRKVRLGDQGNIELSPHPKLCCPHARRRRCGKSAACSSNFSRGAQH